MLWLSIFLAEPQTFSEYVMLMPSASEHAVVFFFCRLMARRTAVPNRVGG